MVYTYYPPNLAYGEEEYRSSPQYQRLLRRRQELATDRHESRRLDHVVRATLKDFAIMDFTDLASHNDFEYRILLHRNQPPLDWDTELMRALGGEKLELLLFVSILSPHYFLILERSRYDEEHGWDFEDLRYYPEHLLEPIEGLKGALQKLAYHELDHATANVIVDGVETELLENGRATIFGCLFTDLVTPKR